MSELCKCGKRIEPCDCGGTACPGYGHLPPQARHWCGTNREDGQPAPVSVREQAREDVRQMWRTAFGTDPS